VAGRAFWLIIAAAAAAAIFSGYAAGAFVISSFQSVPAQGSAWAAPQSPPGLTYPVSEAEIVSASTVPATGACTAINFGNLTNPIALTNGTVTPICTTSAVTGYGQGDTMYVYEITLSHAALVSTTFEIQLGVDVVPTANDIVATVYVATSAVITVSESAIFAIDMTQVGDTSLVSVNVLVTQL
jgi:hypothetical protein